MGQGYWVSPPFEAGLWSLPSAAGFVVGSTAAPRFIHRLRRGLVIATCMSIAAVGLGLLSQVRVWGQLGVVVVGSVLIAVALAPVFNPWVGSPREGRRRIRPLRDR